ncbi:hypothetical protein F4821DRAFT_231379 [Hypoxylon rubiginosum]|uniref:Uncharacterized protein n=1 Tax=Hypoxylon rubiginosum TaxID=110542 RepID=A0ACC0DAM5_9PEZI|nr:hypothetical protein F4821DRAFT_231379 [Hypoxylon rubiginosum]
MARTKQTSRRYERGITWTRFYLPLDQEWPTWPTYEDKHFGPLTNVKGMGKVLLGRMVDNPEQAAYIINWWDLDALKNFRSSPACTEFLQNLPKYDNSQASIESGSALGYLSLGDASSSSSPPPSRLLTLGYTTRASTSDLEGRVTFTAFMVPRKENHEKWMLQEKVKDVFSRYLPLRRINSVYSWPSLTMWFWVLAEDDWVEEKFGKLEQTQEDAQEDVQGRTILCQFRLWPGLDKSTPTHEDVLATNPEVRESWNQAMAEVMPPVTAWAQERWDIRPVPEHEDSEYERRSQEFREGISGSDESMGS